MGKLLQTFLLWAALPYALIIGAAVLYAWPWHVLAVLIALLLLFFGGVALAVWSNDTQFQINDAERQRRRRDAAVQDMLQPRGLDEVPPLPDAPHRRVPGKRPLPRLGHQWRARLK